ncbi:MAG: hypothetical protein ACYDCO_04075 [Armatimonadota bacterium]
MIRFLSAAVAALLLSVLLGCSDHNRQSSSGPGEVTLRTYHWSVPADAPWVMFRDGEGAWQPLAPGATGEYTGMVTNARGRYSLAVGTSTNPAQSSLRLYHATTREMPLIECTVQGEGTPPTMGIAGTISGFPDGSAYAQITGQGGQITPASPAINSWVTEVTRDIVASLFVPTFSNNTPRKLAIRRDLPFSAGTTLTSDVDFNTAPDTVPGAITIANGPADYAIMRLITANGTWAMLAYPNSGSSSFPCVYPAVSQRVAGDVYAVEAENDAKGTRTEAFFTSTGNRTITLPAAFGGDATAGLDVDGLPTADWQAYAGADYYQLIALQFGGAYRSWTIVLSKEWLQGATSYTAPALSTLPGWQPVWSFDGPLTVSLLEACTTSGTINQALTAYSAMAPGPAPADLINTSARKVVLGPGATLTRGQLDALSHPAARGKQ